MTGRPDFELPPSADRRTREVDQEYEAHIEERTAELMARGTTEADARAAATREYGDWPAARAEILRLDHGALRRRSLLEALADLGADIARTLRTLGRQPLFSGAIVATLALGIGANAAAFSLVKGLLLSPPPGVRDARQVFTLGFDERMPAAQRMVWGRGSYPVYQALRASRSPFASLAVTTDLQLGNPVLEVAAATPEYFALLRTRAALGRLSLETDGIAVISHRLWTMRFGSSVTVLDSVLALGPMRYAIVGVAERGFTGHQLRRIDAWIPLTPATPGLTPGWTTMPDMRAFTFVARTGAADTAVARQEATRIYRAAMSDTASQVQLQSLLPGRNAEGQPTPEARVALWLQGVAALTLIIALANLANLMLIRAIDRRTERALHVALGISRGRLVRQSLIESLALAAAGSALALALVRWVAPTLWEVVLPPGADLSWLGDHSLILAAVLAGIATLLMTLVPFTVSGGAQPTDLVRAGGRGLTRRTSRSQHALVVVQVALTVVMLTGAGLFLRSMQRLTAIDIGFDAAGVVVVGIAPGLGSDSAARAERTARAIERLRALPGVRSVAAGMSAPFRPSLNAPIALPGHDSLPAVGPGLYGYPTFFAITPGFLETMGIALLQGRAFTDADGRGSAPVMLVDASMARAWWPGESPLGRCVMIGTDRTRCTTVVGVVEDTRRMITSATHSLRYYLPLAQSPVDVRQRYLFVQTGRPDALLAPVRAVMADVFTPETPVEVTRLTDLFQWQFRPWRLGATAFTGLAVLSAVVALIGLYAATSFGVTRRRREMGIRMALGATRAAVARLVMGETMTRCLLALGIGMVMIGLLGRRFGSLLFQTRAADPLVLGGVALMIVGAAALASALPAWRASRLPPTVTLSSD